MAARSVQRGEQQAARARRRDEPQRAVDGVLGEAAAGTEVQHRRLGQAAAVLVGARDDEVCAQGERVLGQGIGEGQVRAPRLVDDQRHAVRVGDVREAGDVGHRAVVGGRHDDRRRGAGGARERLVERRRPDAVCDAQPRVDLGRHEGGPQPGQDEAVDRAAVDRALHDHASPELGDGQAGRQIALRGAVGQQPRAPGAPRLGREPPCGLVRGDSAVGRDVDALDERRQVERQRVLGERIAQVAVRRDAALVTGHHRPPRAARSVGSQRLEIRRHALPGMRAALGHRRAFGAPRGLF